MDDALAAKARPASFAYLAAAAAALSVLAWGLAGLVAAGVAVASAAAMARGDLRDGLQRVVPHECRLVERRATVSCTAAPKGGITAPG